MTSNAHRQIQAPFAKAYFKPLLLILALIGTTYTQATQSTPLSNADVLQMSQAGFSPETIVAKIKASRSTFDTSPASLTELKSKGVAESVLVAMIAASDPPNRDQTTPPTTKQHAQEDAIKALRKLANAVEVGVSYVNYSPLVVEAKTELETALTKVSSGSFKDAAQRSMTEYQFAATVWQVHWNSDYVYGNYKDIATKQYGVKKRGLLKVVWTTEFLSAIWSEARSYYEAAAAAADPKKVSDSDTSVLTVLGGTWRVRVSNTGAAPTEWSMRVSSGPRNLGELKVGNRTSYIQNLSLADNRFKVLTMDQSGKRGVGPTLEGVVNGNEIKGTIKIKSGSETSIVDFIGTREP